MSPVAAADPTSPDRNDATAHRSAITRRATCSKRTGRLLIAHRADRRRLLDAQAPRPHRPARPPATRGGADRGRAESRRAAGKVKIGFITKFPVDFYDTMVDAAKTWNKDHTRRRGRLRPGQERHRRRGRDHRDRVDGHPGREGHRDHADEPERARARCRRPSTAGHQGRPRSTTTSPAGPASRRSSRPTTSPAACSPGTWLTDHLPAGCQDRRAQGRARATRRSTTGSPACSTRSATRRRSSAEPAHRLRPDQGSERRAGHPDRQSRRHRDLRRLRPADPRRAAGDQERRQRPARSSSSASTRRRTRSTRSWPATEAASVAQFPAKMGSLGVAGRLDAAKGKTRRRPTSTPAPRW